MSLKDVLSHLAIATVIIETGRCRVSLGPKNIDCLSRIIQTLSSIRVLSDNVPVVSQCLTASVAQILHLSKSSMLLCRFH